MYDLFLINWDAISAVVLAATAVLIWQQMRSTKELVENETRPVVEVSIVNDGNGTYVEFLNKKGEIPALVWVTIHVMVEGRQVEELFEPRLMGKEPWRVLHSRYGTNYMDRFQDLIKKYKNKMIEISLEIDLAPLFLATRRSRFYKKFYRFDFEKLQWIDTHWGIPDKPLFPGLRT